MITCSKIPDSHFDCLEKSPNDQPLYCSAIINIWIRNQVKTDGLKY